MRPDTPAGQQLLALVGQPGSRQRVPTPAVLLDIDALDRNIAHMAARAAAAGVALRPHAKSHKCAWIARRQVAAGAVGLCCAKLGEVEALAAAGVLGLLLTSPVVGSDAAMRAARLASQGAGLAVVADHPGQVDALQAACAAAGTQLAVLVDVDVGLGRSGVSNVGAALALATRIQAASALRLVGVQGYGGHWQHICGADARHAAVASGMQRLTATVHALREAGHSVDIVTGGGTGSVAADVSLGVLTELQPGSYVFMDAQYRDALGDDADGQFEHSLTVQARVVSANALTHVTLDAGLKAFATEGPLPRPADPRHAGCRYFWYGDEHGGLTRSPDGPALDLGDRVELIVPHCDPTLDRYDALVLVRDDVVIGVAELEAARRSQ